MDQLISMVMSWQGLVLAVGAGVLSQAVKKVIDVFLADGDKKIRQAWNPAITELLIPSIPILWGMLLTAVVPLRPEALVQYTQGHSGFEVVMIHLLWGALMVGIPADWLYRRFTGVLKMKTRMQ